MKTYKATRESAKGDPAKARARAHRYRAVVRMLCGTIRDVLWQNRRDLLTKGGVVIKRYDSLAEQGDSSRPHRADVETVPLLAYNYEGREQPTAVEKEETPPRLGFWEIYCFQNDDHLDEVKVGCALNHESRLKKARRNEWSPRPIPFRSLGYDECPVPMTQADCERDWEGAVHAALVACGFVRVPHEETGRLTETFKLGSSNTDMVLAVIRSTIARLSQEAA